MKLTKIFLLNIKPKFANKFIYDESEAIFLTNNSFCRNLNVLTFPIVYTEKKTFFFDFILHFENSKIHVEHKGNKLFNLYFIHHRKEFEKLDTLCDYSLNLRIAKQLIKVTNDYENNDIVYGKIEKNFVNHNIFKSGLYILIHFIIFQKFILYLNLLNNSTIDILSNYILLEPFRLKMNQHIQNIIFHTVYKFFRIFNFYISTYFVNNSRISLINIFSCGLIFSPEKIINLICFPLEICNNIFSYIFSCIVRVISDLFVLLSSKNYNRIQKRYDKIQYSNETIILATILFVIFLILFYNLFPIYLLFMVVNILRRSILFAYDLIYLILSNDTYNTYYKIKREDEISYLYLFESNLLFKKVRNMVSFVKYKIKNWI
ncbi:putative N-acetylglucosaminyl transferase [Hamiltosporidium tvaerminnensis]|uniref:Putative N-acetylglucosaminyl transferase n=1 Tax=Hamiltosporidium tvaerminnensis TaxID=1176355 RepID=A0A4V2JXU6_9MICR|nr:putative N-acetylglucosaminyl transferase [Hamiltosporidium tvaerminnensis]